MLYNSIYMKCPGQADLEDPWSRGEEKWRRLRLTANSYRASLQDNEKVLKLIVMMSHNL